MCRRLRRVTGQSHPSTATECPSRNPCGEGRRQGRKDPHCGVVGDGVPAPGWGSGVGMLRSLPAPLPLRGISARIPSPSPSRRVAACPAAYRGLLAVSGWERLGCRSRKSRGNFTTQKTSLQAGCPGGRLAPSCASSQGLNWQPLGAKG